jgi:uncharacterized protein YegP (UPF0339 family)
MKQWLQHLIDWLLVWLLRLYDGGIMAKKRYKLTMTKGVNGDWYWNVEHGNGKIVIAGSEGFRTRAGAKRNLLAAREALGALTSADILAAGR